MSNLPKIYTRSELNVILLPKLNQGIQFGILDGNKELCHFSGGVPSQISWSNNSTKVRDAAERLDLIQISTEFYPSSDSRQQQDAGIKFDNQRDDGWSTWFRKITEGSHLLPDTNILLKRTFTSIIFPRFMLRRHTLALPFNIVIPRLSILELENLANSGRASKGECFMAFNEVRLLKEAGAFLTDPLHAEELTAFYQVAAKQLADAFLREEIRKYGSSKRLSHLSDTRHDFRFNGKF